MSWQGEVMHRGIRIGLGCAAIAVSGVAIAQAPAPASVRIDIRPGVCVSRCGVFLVNNSKTDRAVATINITVAGDQVSMTDFGRNDFTFRTPSTQVVLLFPGQEMRFPPSIDLHGNGADVRPFTYTIAGAYVPRPDLMELPAGRAQDWVRIRSENFTQYMDTCPLGRAQLLAVRNLNLARTVAVSFRNTTPGRRTDAQTLYLAPGDDAPIGCANEWQNIQFIGAEFAG